MPMLLVELIKDEHGDKHSWQVYWDTLEDTHYCLTCSRGGRGGGMQSKPSSGRLWPLLRLRLQLPPPRSYALDLRPCLGYCLDNRDTDTEVRNDDEDELRSNCAPRPWPQSGCVQHVRDVDSLPQQDLKSVLFLLWPPDLRPYCRKKERNMVNKYD